MTRGGLKAQTGRISQFTNLWENIIILEKESEEEKIQVMIAMANMESVGTQADTSVTYIERLLSLHGVEVTH